MSKWIELEYACSDEMCKGVACADCPFQSDEGCKNAIYLMNLPSIDIVRCKECKYHKNRIDYEADYCIEHSKVLYDTGGGCSWGKE